MTSMHIQAPLLHSCLYLHKSSQEDDVAHRVPCIVYPFIFGSSGSCAYGMCGFRMQYYLAHRYSTGRAGGNATACALARRALTAAYVLLQACAAAGLCYANALTYAPPLREAARIC